MLDLTQARADYAAYMMTTPYTITRTYPTATTITGLCAFGPRSGRVEQGGDQVVERGSYQMGVPVGTAILATDRPVIAGRTFRIVWTPPASDTSVGLMFGLEEVR